MQLLSTLIYTFLFIVLLGITLYNWMYTKGAEQAKQNLGIALPPLLAKLVYATLILSALATITMGVLATISFFSPGDDPLPFVDLIELF